MNSISLTENRILMAQARESLKGKWGVTTGTIIVYLLIIGPIQIFPLADGFLTVFTDGAFSVGLAIFWLSIAGKGETRLRHLFGGFRRFRAAFRAYLLQTIFIISGLLCFIIPGIITGLSLSMTFFIIAEEGETGAFDAINKSSLMMYGNKWKLFCLGCRFFGWGILSLLTIGIGFLWLYSYFMVSVANFYEDIKQGNGEETGSGETVN